MKKVFILLLIFSHIALNAQSDGSSIKKEFETYIDLLINKKFDQSLNYITEEIFTVVSREQMLATFEKTFSDPNVILELGKPIILNVRSIQKENTKFYSILKYKSKNRMKILSEESFESAQDKNEQLEFMKNSFIEQFGEENVSFDKETEFFDFTATKEVICVSLNGMSDWKFIEASKAQKDFFITFIPAAVIDLLEK
jgi:hypothetical protein